NRLDSIDPCQEGIDGGIEVTAYHKRMFANEVSRRGTPATFDQLVDHLTARSGRYSRSRGEHLGQRLRIGERRPPAQEPVNRGQVFRLPELPADCRRGTAAPVTPDCDRRVDLTLDTQAIEPLQDPVRLLLREGAERHQLRESLDWPPHRERDNYDIEI